MPHMHNHPPYYLTTDMASRRKMQELSQLLSLSPHRHNHRLQMRDQHRQLARNRSLYNFLYEKETR